MSHLRTFKHKLTEIARLWERQQYDKALAVVAALRQAWPGNAHLHVLWARLVQLSDHQAPSLAEAKQALQAAAELEPDAPTPNIELGHFADAVEDDLQLAALLFGRAGEAARRRLIESLLGEARAQLQLNQREPAVACVVEALSLSEWYRNVKLHEKPLEIVWRGLNGQFHRGQVAGPYAREIEALLDEMFLNRSA